MTSVHEPLRISVGALSLKNPVICASGEHVMTEAGIRAALDAGAAVVVAKSINESQAARDQLGQTDYLRTGPSWVHLPWHGQGGSVLCRSGLQPRACADWISAVAALDREAAAHDAYVAGSIILAGLEAAVALARDYEAAGIRLLEFNVGTPYGDEASHGGVATERAASRIHEQVMAVTSAVRIPVWVKLTGQSENVAALATAARKGGAAAVTMIGRMLGMLPDLETMAPALDTNLGYGGPWALPLTCYWLARSRRTLGNDYPLIGTNGARSGHDVARMLLAGASAVEMCSAVMTGGFGVLRDAIDQLAAYLDSHDAAAQAIVGRAADRVRNFADLPARGDVWREFVPPATLKA
jgi:dihydroorotate dehydrogenase (NAD+) catalytic subunit